MRGKLRVAKTCGLFAAVVLLSWLALELPWNTNLFGAEHWLGVPLSLIAVAWAVIALAVLGVYLIGQCTWWFVPLVPIICCCLGIGQHFVNEFKSSSIMPSDFTVLSTAAAVAGGYTYSLTPRIVASAAVAVTAVVMTIAESVSMRAKRRGKNQVHRENFERSELRRYAVWGYAAAKLVAGIGCFVGIAALAVSPAFISFLESEEEATGIGSAASWDLAAKYEADGFIPGFILVNAGARPALPEGYSDSAAEAVQREASEAYRQQITPGQKAAQEQFSSLKPTVIAVLNESFADLKSIYGDMGVGYEGPEFFRTGMPDALLHGKISVPVLGGGTCNSEFEFLTSTPLAFAGDHHYPFVHFDFSRVGNMARSFKELGYRTTAVHPMPASDFNRDQVFEQMGFDYFVAEDAFNDAPQLHMGVTDRAVYQKTLDMLASDSSPQFIFDITMQNHGGYRTKLLPKEMLPQLQPKGLSEQTTGELNQYLGLISASDSDLQWFVQQLRDLERPVVLIFFGDHQPLFTPDIGALFTAPAGDDSSDKDSFDDASSAGEDSVSIAQESAEIGSAQRLYTTNYAVWANYDVAGQVEETHDMQGILQSTLHSTGQNNEQRFEESGVDTERFPLRSTDGKDTLPVNGPERIDTSLDLLLPVAMRAVGGPLTEYQQALLQLRGSIPQMNQYGALDVGGKWYSLRNLSEAPFESDYCDLALIGYANVQLMQH